MSATKPQPPSNLELPSGPSPAALHVVEPRPASERVDNAQYPGVDPELGLFFDERTIATDQAEAAKTERETVKAKNAMQKAAYKKQTGPATDGKVDEGLESLERVCAEALKLLKRHPHLSLERTKQLIAPKVGLSEIWTLKLLRKLKKLGRLNFHKQKEATPKH